MDFNIIIIIVEEVGVACNESVSENGVTVGAINSWKFFSVELL